MTLRFSTPMPLVGPRALPPGLTPIAPGSTPLQDVLNMRLGVDPSGPAASSAGFSPGQIPSAIGGFVSRNEKPLSMAGKALGGAYAVYSDMEERKARRDEERRRREEEDRKRRQEEAAGQAMAPVGAQILEALSRRLGTRAGGG
jgi:hypothetical protein